MSVRRRIFEGGALGGKDKSNQKERTSVLLSYFPMEVALNRRTNVHGYIRAGTSGWTFINNQEHRNTKVMKVASRHAYACFFVFLL